MTLRHLHDTQDAAVAAAYGWSADLPAADVVARLVALNAQRLAEERAGTVRWLRPAFQAPAEALASKREQFGLDVDEAEGALPPWPKDTVEHYQAVLSALSRGVPVLAAELAKQ